MKPLIFAHRGASGHEPDNTLAAFAAAVSFGADGVELDVRPTVDGSLAVAHDAELPDGRLIAETQAAGLPGSVCLLADALAACGPLLVNVEVKSDEPGVGVRIAGAVLEVVATWSGTVVLSSFDPATIDECRRLAPSVATAQLTWFTDRPLEELLAWVRDRGHEGWHPHHLLLDEAAVAAAHGAGLAVRTWTVDDPDRLRALAGWGVDAVVVNDVPAARAALGR